MSRIVWTFAFLAMLLISQGRMNAAERSNDVLSKKELKALVLGAKTPADYEKLARHYRAKAAELLAESREHEEMIVEQRKTALPNPHEQMHPMSPNTEAHCRHFATATKEAAEKAQSLAAAYAERAKQSAK